MSSQQSTSDMDLYQQNCIQQLMSLGFSQEQAEHALHRTEFDVELAAEMLLQGISLKRNMNIFHLNGW